MWLDGQIAGASLKSYIEGLCGGEGLRISNDIGSTKTAFGITVDYPSLEFTIGPGVHITGNAYELAINKGFWVDSGWKNFVSCQASAGLVIDNGSHNISVDGGQIAASSGAGVYSNGTNITLRPGGVFNNSNPNVGGTKNTCAGVEFGALSSGGVVSGAAIGYTLGQAEPVLLDSGAQNISVTGNSFLAGNLLNHVVNNSPNNGNVISCNAGADINDCTSALGNSGIEFVYPSSGSVGSNGALSVNTAIDNAYTQSYVYLPTGVVAGNASFTGASGATFTGAINNTTLTTTGTAGYISVGDVLYVLATPSGPSYAVIRSQIDGTTGGDGDYVISVGDTVTATAMSTTSKNLIVSSVASGTIYVGAALGGSGVPANLVIVTSPGGSTGTYTISRAAYIPSESLTTTSAAGWYWAVWSDTSDAQLYGNSYPGGNPVVPSPLISLSGSAGSGSYVQTTGSNIVSLSFPMGIGQLALGDGVDTMVNATFANSAHNKIFDLQYAATAAGGTAFVYGTGTLTTTAQWSCGASGLVVQAASVEVPLSTNNVSGCTGATTAADLFGAVPTGAVSYLQVAVDMADASDYIVIHGVSEHRRPAN